MQENLYYVYRTTQKEHLKNIFDCSQILFFELGFVIHVVRCLHAIFLSSPSRILVLAIFDPERCDDAAAVVRLLLGDDDPLAVGLNWLTVAQPDGGRGRGTVNLER